MAEEDKKKEEEEKKKGNSSIIIKKVKKGGHGHHGGAWKVAYADFVTAMMAFFLLMWLLNATEAEELQALADYFAPTIGLKDELGIGFKGGIGPISEGVSADKLTNKGIIYGGLPTGPIVKVIEKIEVTTEEPDAEKLAIIIGGNIKEDSETDSTASSELAESLENFISEVSEGAQQKVSVVQKPKGLEIEIREEKGESMFEGDTAKLRPEIIQALKKLSEIFVRLPNYISISGHTSSVAIKTKENYGNWELSADRANAARRVLVEAGVQDEQLAEVVGKSDNDPIDTANPSSAVNNRIGIVLLRGSTVLPSHKKGAPEGVFIDSQSNQAKEFIEDKPEIETEQDKKDNENNEKMKKTVEEMDGNTNPTEEEKIQAKDPFTGDLAPLPENLFIKDPELETDNSLETPGEEFLKIDIKEKEIKQLQEMEVNDPFKGNLSPAPDKLFTEEKLKNKKVLNKDLPNADLFEEEQEIKPEEFIGKANRFNGKGASAAPMNILLPIEEIQNDSKIEIKEEKPEEPKNIHLFEGLEEDEEVPTNKKRATGREYLPGLDPISGSEQKAEKRNSGPIPVNSDLFKDEFEESN